MKNSWSKTWKSSAQPRKQRKYVYNAPLHVSGKFLSSHLAKDLRTKYGKRSVIVVKGDKVKIMRGQFKGIEGKVEDVNHVRKIVHVAGAQQMKVNNTKAYYPLNASILLITSLNLNDKKRIAMLERKQEAKPVRSKIMKLLGAAKALKQKKEQ